MAFMTMYVEPLREIEMSSLMKYSERPVRIFLANQPRLLRQMLRRAIQKSPDLRVVGEGQRLVSVAALPEIMNIDWFVVSLGQNGQLPVLFQKLAEKYPPLKVIGISNDGNEVTLKEGTEPGRRIENISLQSLLDLFRQ